MDVENQISIGYIPNVSDMIDTEPTDIIVH